jgi:hypothetical protein
MKKPNTMGKERKKREKKAKPQSESESYEVGREKEEIRVDPQKNSPKIVREILVPLLRLLDCLL